MANSELEQCSQVELKGLSEIGGRNMWRQLAAHRRVAAIVDGVPRPHSLGSSLPNHTAIEFLEPLLAAGSVDMDLYRRKLGGSPNYAVCRELIREIERLGGVIELV